MTPRQEAARRRKVRDMASQVRAIASNKLEDNFVSFGEFNSSMIAVRPEVYEKYLTDGVMILESHGRKAYR